MINSDYIVFKFKRYCISTESMRLNEIHIIMKYTLYHIISHYIVTHYITFGCNIG